MMSKRSGMLERSEGYRGGFTLVEVLVAVVIFGVVMLALFSSFQAFVSSGQVIAGIIRSEDRARIALDRMEKDLRLIFVSMPPRYRRPDFRDDPDPYRFFVKQERMGGRTFSRMEFSSFARIETESRGYHSISGIVYYVRENSRGGFDLYRADRPAGSEESVDPCRDPCLLKDILAFDAIPVDAEAETAEEWNSDTEANDHRMPESIVIKFSAASETGQVRYFETAVALPVNRSVGD